MKFLLHAGKNCEKVTVLFSKIQVSVGTKFSPCIIYLQLYFTGTVLPLILTYWSDDIGTQQHIDFEWVTFDTIDTKKTYPTLVEDVYTLIPYIWKFLKTAALMQLPRKAAGSEMLTYASKVNPVNFN